MAEKHLRELLKEDQEPFLLKQYISERRNQLKKKHFPNSTLLKNKQPQPQPQPKLPLNKCFLSLHTATKSPLLEFTCSSSPKTKSPLRPSNAKTATLLLEAALRIHKHPNRAFGFNNLFGSLFKRLSNRKRDIEAAKDEVVGSGEVGSTCSCNGRPSSAVWSESLESSSSAHSFDDSIQEIHFLKRNHESVSCDDHDHFLCQSPFRFSLQRSPDYSGRRTPEFSSPPPVSPSRHRTEDKEINGADDVNKFQSGEEEEDKEQCSPVSVLDPPFHDDDDDDDDVHENDHGENGFDLDCSYANVQRTKQHLLDRLRRFEKLAELDPLELEKRMLDQDDQEYETFIENDDYEDVDSETTCEEKALRETALEILCHSRVHDIQHPPEDLKRLIYDLIMEEETQVINSEEERNMVIRRVLKRLELWKEVDSNTIDMMIEEDFSREEGKWKKNAEKTKELAVELEDAIFFLLVEELSEELVC